LFRLRDMKRYKRYWSVSDEMYIHQMDIISAYVQDELHDEIYMEQPEMLVQNKQKDKVCKLLKPLYGLKQSGRNSKKSGIVRNSIVSS